MMHLLRSAGFIPSQAADVANLRREDLTVIVYAIPLARFCHVGPSIRWKILGVVGGVADCLSGADC